MTKPPRYESRHIIRTLDGCPACRGHRFVMFFRPGYLGEGKPLHVVPHVTSSYENLVGSPTEPGERFDRLPSECQSCGAVLS